MEYANERGSARSWAQAERLFRNADAPERVIRAARKQFETRQAKSRILELRARMERDLRRRGII